MHHWIPGEDQPLNPVMEDVKTNEPVLRGASTTSVIRITKKKMM